MGIREQCLFHMQQSQSRHFNPFSLIIVIMCKLVISTEKNCEKFELKCISYFLSWCSDTPYAEHSVMSYGSLDLATPEPTGLASSYSYCALAAAVPVPGALEDTPVFPVLVGVFMSPISSYS